MIIGLNRRQEDMEINACKAKHLTNMRSSSSDGVVQLTPLTDLSLEQCIDFIEDDELLGKSLQRACVFASVCLIQTFASAPLSHSL